VRYKPAIEAKLSIRYNAAITALFLVIIRTAETAATIPKTKNNIISKFIVLRGISVNHSWKRNCFS
jgi:hypothetical protein